eukprot:4850940-Alexandrium_andersonii.AAC.1
MASCDAGVPVKLRAEEVPPQSQSSPTMPPCVAICVASAHSCIDATQPHHDALSAAAAPVE